MSNNSPLSPVTKVEDAAKSPVLVVPAPAPSREGESGSAHETSSDDDDAKSTSTTVSSDGPLLGEAGESASTTSEPDEHYPEGGIRAWLVVLGSWLALFASVGFMSILAIFQTYTSDDTIYPGSGVAGAIISSYTLLSLALGIYVGSLFDKYGPRWLILSGTASLVTSLLLVSFTTQFWLLLSAFGILSSFGTSLLFTPSIAAIGHFFQTRRGLATGIASTAGPAAGVVFPRVLDSLVSQIGWHRAIRALALIFLVLTLVANVLIRSRLPPPPSTTAAPIHPTPSILRTKGFALTLLALFLAQFAAAIPLTYLSSYLITTCFARPFPLTVATVLNASSVVGRVAAGWAADRDKMGPLNANILASTAAAMACLVVWLPAGGTRAGMVVFAVVFGAASGAGVGLMPVSVGKLCGTHEYGRYYGTTYAVVSLAVVVAVAMAGTVVEFEGLIALTAVLYVASAVIFAVANASVGGKEVWLVRDCLRLFGRVRRLLGRLRRRHVS